MSYGTNAPSGFQSYGTQTAASFTGQTALHAIQSGSAEPIFTGDPVIVTGGFLLPVTEGPEALKGMSCGVFQGCQWKSPDPNVWGLAKSPYWPANTIVQAYEGTQSGSGWVIVDPNATWNIQVSVSKKDQLKKATVTAAQIGQYANWSVGGEDFEDDLIPNNPEGGNTSTGQSGVYLDAITLTEDILKAPLKILGFTPIPGNGPGLLFNNVLVGWNPHFSGE
jgi:hypothetical protein